MQQRFKFSEVFEEIANLKDGTVTKKDQCRILTEVLESKGCVCKKKDVEDAYDAFLAIIFKKVLKDGCNLPVMGMGKLYQRIIQGREYTTFLKGVQKTYKKESVTTVGFKPYPAAKVGGESTVIEKVSEEKKKKNKK